MYFIKANFLFWLILFIFWWEFHFLVILMFIDVVLVVLDVLSNEIPVTFLLVLANHILQLLFPIRFEQTLWNHETVVNCYSYCIEVDSKHFQLRTTVQPFEHVFFQVHCVRQRCVYFFLRYHWHHLVYYLAKFIRSTWKTYSNSVSPFFITRITDVFII